MCAVTDLIDSHNVDSTAEVRVQRIHKILRERIGLLYYAPNSRLTESVLAKEFNLSRTPIRRVLGRLVDDGLVEVHQGLGNFVTQVKLKDLCKVYRLRAQLTRLIPLLSPKPITQDLLDCAHNLHRRCLNIEKHAQPKTEYTKVNLQVFKLVMRLVGNPPLASSFERLFYVSARMWPYLLDNKTFVEESRRFAEEIASLARLLQSGDISAFCEMRAKHLEDARRRMIVAAIKKEEVKRFGAIHS